MKKVFVGLILICDFIIGFSQEKKDLAVYLGRPMIVDTNGVIKCDDTVSI
jgi:hypothetical protein